MSDADITRAMLADLDSMKGGTVFDATQVDSFDNETSERNPFGKGHNLQSVRDPIGYTRATPDPKHHGQAMCSPMRTEWIKSQGLEMQGLGVEASFRKSYGHLSLPKIEFSALASTTRLKEKEVNSTNAKSDSSYKVNT